MAASAGQPHEMTELASQSLDSPNAASTSQSATTPNHDEASPSSSTVKPQQQGDPATASTINPQATNDSRTEAQPEMYPLASKTNNEDGTLRGANNSSDNVSKLESGENAASTAPMATPAAEAASTNIDADVKDSPFRKDGPITTVTSAQGAEQESQEKGDQVILELVRVQDKPKCDDPKQY